MTPLQRTRLLLVLLCCIPAASAIALLWWLWAWTLGTPPAVAPEVIVVHLFVAVPGGVVTGVAVSEGWR